MNKRAYLWINRLKEIAKEKNGIIITPIEELEKELKRTARVTVRCNNSKHDPYQHLVSKVLHKGYWCHDCDGRQKRNRNKDKYYDELKAAVENKGGKLLSKEYKTAKTSVLVQCDNLNHPPFENTPYHLLKRNQWCPICVGRKGDFDIQVKNIIEEQEGTMIGKYVNNHTPIEITCSGNHTFYSSPANLKAGKWRPMCSMFKRQTECHKIIEELTGKQFIFNDRKKLSSGLELDGYNAELNLAYEYNGEQHYYPIDFFGGEETFIKIQRRDKRKLKECEELGIYLITIPYTVKDLRSYIRNKLQQYANTVPSLSIDRKV